MLTGRLCGGFDIGGSKTEIRSPAIENKDIVAVKALPRPKMLKAEEGREHHLQLVAC